MAKRELVPTPGGITLEMYLAFENASDIKHEFVEGRVYAMTGELAHGARVDSSAHPGYTSRPVPNGVSRCTCVRYRADPR